MDDAHLVLGRELVHHRRSVDRNGAADLHDDPHER